VCCKHEKRPRAGDDKGVKPKADSSHSKLRPKQQQLLALEDFEGDEKTARESEEPNLVLADMVLNFEH
jgi:hypothetical protein